MSGLATAGLDAKTTAYLEMMAAKNPDIIPVLERAAVHRLFNGQRQPNTKPSKVYFARRPDNGFIKIGTSSDPAARVRALQTGAGIQLQLLATIDGGRNRERELHERFDGYRMSGEWFAPAPELLAFMSAVAK